LRKHPHLPNRRGGGLKLSHVTQVPVQGRGRGHRCVQWIVNSSIRSNVGPRLAAGPEGNGSLASCTDEAARRFWTDRFFGQTAAVLFFGPFLPWEFLYHSKHKKHRKILANNHYI